MSIKFLFDLKLKRYFKHKNLLRTRFGTWRSCIRHNLSHFMSWKLCFIVITSNMTEYATQKKGSERFFIHGNLRKVIRFLQKNSSLKIVVFNFKYNWALFIKFTCEKCLFYIKIRKFKLNAMCQPIVAAATSMYIVNFHVETFNSLRCSLSR